jgi:hypothetical protein
MDLLVRAIVGGRLPLQMGSRDAAIVPAPAEMSGLIPRLWWRAVDLLTDDPSNGVHAPVIPHSGISIAEPCERPLETLVTATLDVFSEPRESRTVFGLLAAWS